MSRPKKAPSISTIRKRDGSIAPFDPAKIENAIRKAMTAVHAKDGTKAREVTGRVVQLLEKFAKRSPSVEDVQDLVERALIDARLAEVAKAYILYRKRRAEIRQAKKFLGVRDELKLSVNAIGVLERRYLMKDEEGRVVETPSQMFRRVARAVAQIDSSYGEDSKVEDTEEEFYRVMANLEFLPNSPTLMNAGTKLGQLSACFVLPVEDSMAGIFDAVRTMALIHQTGGGTGFSFSHLRPKGDMVSSTGGIASGPVSFMRIFDTATDVIKQGGRRRGANMAILRVDHPDVLEFIAAKEREGFLANFNLSVAVTDKFMRAVQSDRTYRLVNPRTKKPVRELRARDVWNIITSSAWRTGDPGLVFIDEINRHNPTPQIGTIESTNPCVAGDAYVSTEQGLMRIADLAHLFPDGGIKVVSDPRTEHPRLTTSAAADTSTQQDGRVSLYPVLRAFKTGLRKTVRVRTHSGFEVVVTPDHRMLTSEGWIEAGRLVPERHKILIQSIEGHFSSEKTLPFEVPRDFLGRNGRTYTLNLPQGWTEELGFVLGWLVGDGWLATKTRNWRVGFTFGKQDRAVIAFVKKLMDKWYGKPIKEVRHPSGVLQLSYHSKNLAWFFNRLGVLPVSSELKRVPGTILTAPKSAVIGFLRGLFSSDGSVDYLKDKSALVKLTSTSLNLLRGVQLLLLNLGILSKIYIRTRPPRRGFPYTTVRGEKKTYTLKRRCFELYITKTSALRFLGKIGFFGEMHSAKIVKLRSKTYYSEKFEDPVAAIEPNGREEVYDMIEPATGTFVANGLVVHNCGEQPLLANESCNLGSINLSRMVTGDRVDWGKLRKTVKTAVHFLDNIIDANKFPTPEVERMTKSNRKIGLGVMGLAEAFIKMRIPYNSERALSLARRIMRFITDVGHEACRELGERRGPFPNFKGSVWERRGYKAMRNATVTTIAPTGTIGIIAGTSSGIEPIFAVSFVRSVMEGTRLLEVNPIFEEAARQRGFYSEELMMKIARTGSVQQIDEVPEDMKRIFVTAFDISPEWHVRMQAAFQRYTDNAVSKTINLPHDCSVEDVAKAYWLAYKLRCKGITVYRYGSKREQVLYIGSVIGRETGQVSDYVSADAEYGGGCPTPICSTS